MQRLKYALRFDYLQSLNLIPRANELLIRRGNPISLLNSVASSFELTTLLGAVNSPISSSIFLNLSLSSASTTVSRDDPSILMSFKCPCS